MKIKSLIAATSLAFLLGCGGGGDSIVSGIDVVYSKVYVGGSDSYLLVCNNSGSVYNIVDLRSNPTYVGDDGPNRLSYDILPGECKRFTTSNCDTTYLIDVTYEDGEYYRDSYFRECGYEHQFDLLY